MKKIRNILICINLVFVLCFLAALFVPVERKDTLYSSTDASIYDKKSMIPKLGAITDSRDAETDLIYMINKYMGSVCIFV